MHDRRPAGSLPLAARPPSSTPTATFRSRYVAVLVMVNGIGR
jgi:hypothetical protein